MAERPYITGKGLPVKSVGIFISLLLTLSVVNGAAKGSTKLDTPNADFVYVVVFCFAWIFRYLVGFAFYASWPITHPRGYLS